MSDQGGNDAGDRDGAAGASGDPRLTAPTDVAQQPRLPFPVVGVGASAGGLEAYIELLQAAPADAGLAWVLIQHLPPDRESLVADILGKKTAMPVLQVEDGVPVRPDHVYVIRPGNTLTIKDGRLRLGAPLEAPGHRRPVDDFFRSLAEEQQQRAVAVVLSGMGSNGSAGAQAIKAVGGLCIAQDPESAKFPSMPRSLIDAHLADYVLRAAEMPEAIARYARHPYAQGDRSAEKVARRATQALQEILAVIRTRTRHDFSGYRKPTLVRRVQRRMGLNQIADMAEYARVLRQTPGEVSALADDLLIHVTGFFRDPEVWDVVRDKVISPLAAGRPDGAPIRAWVAACATGDEACTLAMLLVEAAEAAGKQFDIKVFATDMAERALGQARAGVFPGGIESEVSAERLDRFFDKDDATYRVKKALRELVVFAPQNVLQDPPFSRLDIITCRNFLIYLEPDVQRRVLALLHFGLREGGALLLGTSETVGAGEGEFEPIDKKHRLYRRVGPTRHGALDFSALAAPAAAGEANGERAARPQPRAPVAQLVNRALLDHHTPAAIVVDRDGQIVYFHGDTSPYLDQPRGEPSRDLLALANDQVRGSLRTAFHKAVSTGGPVAVRDGLIETPDGRRRVEVRVTPLDRRAGRALYLVVLADHPERPPVAEATAEPAAEAKLVDELQRARDELQSTIEELQTSNEELKASHEEVTSINEELQSTNEELETSKEEMQSLNEELTTVNAQLQAKMDELERTSNDLASLLASTDLAVIFLDTKFRIRRFTPAVRDLIDLIASDVGRPVLDLRRKFDDPQLLADAQFVLDRLVPVEKEVDGDGGRAYLRRVTPYRTTDNRIDGVVVTFVDITQRRADEAAVRASEEKYRTLFDTIDEGFCIIEVLFDGGRPADYRFLEANPAFERQTGLAGAVGRRVRELVPGLEAHWFETYGRVAETGEPVRFQQPAAGLDRHFDVYAFRVGPADARRVAVLFTDITDRKRRETHQDLLVEIGGDVSRLVTPDEIARAVGARLGRHLRLGTCVFVDVDEERGQVTARYGWNRDGVHSLKETYRFADYVTDEFARGSRANKPWVIRDTANDPRVNGGALARLNVAAWLAVPFLQEGRWTAHLTVTDTEPRDWRDDEIELMRTVADRVFPRFEHARAEAALRESRAFHELVADLGSDWWFSARIDPDGTAVTEAVGGGFTRLLGYTRDELTAAGGWEVIVHPDDRPEAGRQMARLLAGETIDGELRHVARDGRVSWSQYRTRPEADAAGRVVRVYGVARDITDRKRSEAELRASETRYRRLFNSSLIGMMTVLEDGRVLDANAAFLRVVGRTRADLEAGRLNWKEITPPDELAAELEAAKTRTTPAGEVAPYEKNYLRPDGTAVPVLLGGAFVEGAAGEGVCFVLDLSDRKRADAALRASEERFRRLAETVPQIVWTSVGGAVDYYNPRWYEYTGRGPTADPDGWPDVIHPDDQPEALRRGAETLRTGDPYEMEYRLRRADGAYRWHIARAVRVPGSDRWIGTATDIHDLKEADAAVRASEGRFRAVAANLPGGAVFVVGPDLRYELAEGQGLRDAGFTAADYEGKTLAEALPPDLAAASEANCRRALAGEPFLAEHAAGDRRFVTRGVPLRDPDGRVTAALAVSYDITDRVRAEGAVRASEERLRLLVESVRDHAILALDPDGRVTSWNPAAERVFGYAADEIVGRSGEVIFTPEDRAAGLPGRELATAAAEGRATDENWAVRKDGSRFWASGVSSAVRDPDGRLTGFVKVLRDRTEARQAAAAVQQAEERLRLALGAARMGIWTWDPAAGSQTRDGNMNRLLGLPAGDTTQPFGDFLARIHPDDRPEVAAAFAFAAEYGQPLNLEFRVVRPDGAVRWFRDQGDVFGGAGGPARQLTGAVVDVTERREAEEAVRRARDELEVRVRERTAELAEALVTLRDEVAARRELAGRLSTAQEDERRRLARELHDSVGQYLAALAVGLKVAEAEAGAASPAAGRLRKLSDLTQEVGRETHRLALELRPTVLDDAGLEAAVRTYVEAWAERTGIPAEFTAAGPDGGASSPEAVTAVYRVIQEALTNVLKHAGASRVSVILRRDAQSINAIIEDNGRGFGLDRVIGTARATGGLGLIGMRERVTLVGGTLDIESDPASGTTVYVRVPAPKGS